MPHARRRAALLLVSPAGSSAAALAAPAGPPAGRYNCFDVYVALGESTRVSHKPALFILGPDRYNVLAESTGDVNCHLQAD